MAKNLVKHDNCVVNITKMRDASKVYKAALKQNRRDYYKDMNCNIKKLHSTDPKAYWNMLKSKNSRNHEMPNLKDFENHFGSLNAGDEILNDDEEKFMKSAHEYPNSDLNRPFTNDEVMYCIKNLKNNKAAGEDLIINEFLKSTADMLINVYVKLFNIVLNTGIVPAEWLSGFIIPIYKNKGERTDVDNYRGIILSCFGKLFTSVVNYRLTKFSDEHDLIGHEQAGFRKGFSTIDHVFTLSVYLICI